MPRILFLHGFTQSGNTLRHKTGALSKALAKYAEITYPTAPIKLELPDSSDPAERERYAKFGIDEAEGAYAWWKANEKTEDLDGLDQTLSYIKRILETEGPFDGIMGFSQGAGVAALLTSLLERKNPLLVTSHPPFKFAVIFSGFKSRFKRHEWIYENGIETPILHVIGQNDPIVTPERSQMLVDVSRNAEVLMHPGSHFVPSAAPYKSRIVDFILSRIRPRMSMTCIVAADKDYGIGKDGGLPWSLKKEMKYFSTITSSSPRNIVIMGRNSWTSIPERFRPLKGRINVVITSRELEVPGIIVAKSLEEALLLIYKTIDSPGRIFIIGGAQLYRAALEHPECDRILLTSIDAHYDCDTYFPMPSAWRESNQVSKFTALESSGDSEQGVEWRYRLFERPSL